MNKYTHESPKTEKLENKLYVHKVEEDREGQRLDNYLISKTKLPKSLIYNLLRRGKVRINTEKKEPSYRLESSDHISIPLQYISGPQSQAPAADKKEFKPEQIAWLDNTIMEENEHFMIINKPSGLASHGGSGHAFGLIELLRQRYPHQTLELVHRLDRETSGIMVVAKKRSALRALNELFAQREMQKTYLAILSGVCRHKKVIDAPLGITRNKGIRQAFVDHQEGVQAHTSFIPLSKYQGKSLCLVLPKTGRMHQIRAHAASMNLPIRGDSLYQGEEANRLFLHSTRLSFTYDNREWVFEQSPPEFWEEEFFNGWNLWKTINKQMT